jgi:hypothetical protein
VKKLRTSLKSLDAMPESRVVTSSQILDLRPKDGFLIGTDNGTELERIQKDIRELKALVGHYQRSASDMDAKILQQFKDLLKIDREKIGGEIDVINERIDECAKKSDLYEMLQFFKGMGSGEVDFVLQPRSRLASQMSMGDVGRGGMRQISPHVKLINGESLKRPSTSQYRRS